MSDHEAWTEAMRDYCITPYPPEIPKAEKQLEKKKITKENKEREKCLSQRNHFD